MTKARRTALGLATLATLSPGCGADQPARNPDLDRAESSMPDGGNGIGCTSCGYNGLPWPAAPELPDEVGRFGRWADELWPEGNIGPYPICDPPTVGRDGCMVHPQWDLWLGLEPNGMHADQFKYLVRFAAPQGFFVQTSFGSYAGQFGLAEVALMHKWDLAQQEIISSGLSALANHSNATPMPFPCLGESCDHVPNFYICLKTPWRGECSDDFVYVESIFYGNLFQDGQRGMSGGPDAPDPFQNLRTGRSATPMMFTWLHHWSEDEGPCKLTGSGAGQRPLACDGVDGTDETWRHPVAVLTNFIPSDWYYDTGSQTLPMPPEIELE